jgi:hypothetical protein
MLEGSSTGIVVSKTCMSFSMAYKLRVVILGLGLWLLGKLPTGFYGLYIHIIFS